MHMTYLELIHFGYLTELDFSLQVNPYWALIINWPKINNQCILTLHSVTYDLNLTWECNTIQSLSDKNLLIIQLLLII